MDDLIKRFETLKSQKESLDRQVTQEEASFSTLKTQYATDLKAFCTKYKVTSLDEAKKLLSNQEQELNTLISKAEEALKVFVVEPTDSFPDLNL